MEKEIEIDYIPVEMVVGIKVQRPNAYGYKYNQLYNNGTTPAGIVVCNFGSYKWTNDSGFKYVSGHTRSNYRDIAKRIQRDIEGTVFNLKNEPTSGFKLLNERYSIYSEVGAREQHTFPILDPRGFVIGLTRSQYLNLITNVKIENGVILDKLVYYWKDCLTFGKESSIKFPMLISTKDDNYKNLVASSKKLDNLHTAKKQYKTKKDLVPGKIYIVSDKKQANGKSKYLYLGKKKSVDSKLWKKLMEQYPFIKDPCYDFYYRRLKKINGYANIMYKQQGHAYYYDYDYSSLYRQKEPWEDYEWIEFINDYYPNLYVEQDCFLKINDVTTENSISIFNKICSLYQSNTLVNITKEELKKHVHLKIINDVFNNCTNTIPLNKIIEEEDPKSNSFIDFKTKECFNYFMNITEKLSAFVSNAMQITLKNFPVNFTWDDKHKRYDWQETDAWYYEEYIPNPLFQDCSKTSVTKL